MDKFISKTQMQTILDSRPKGVSMDEVINGYRSNGYKVEGIDQKPQPEQTVVQKAGDLAVGFGKGLARTAVNTATGLQNIGQGAMKLAGASDKTLAETGFNSLDTSTTEGQALQQAIQPTNDMQKAGGMAETGAELLAGGGAGLIKDAVVGGSKLVAKGVSPVLNSVKPVGNFIYSRAFTPSAKEAENILAYEATKPSIASSIYGAGALEGNAAFKPITVADTALRSGIAGTEKQVGVQAKQVADTLYKKQISPAVDSIKETLTKDELFAPLRERIAQITDPSKKKAYQNAYDSLAEDYANIEQFTYKEAQKLKSELAQFTPAKIFRGQDVANETRMLQADIASTIRQKTYDLLKDSNIRQKYIDYGNLQELQKVGVKAISEAGTKGGFGGFWSTMYDTAMTPVKTIGGKMLYKIGDKLQVTAPKGFEGKSFADYLRSVGYLAPQVADEVVTEQK